MPLHVLCPKCNTRYQVEDHQVGGTGTCPQCGTLARIPSSDDAAGAEVQIPVSETAAASVDLHRRMIGVFCIAVALLNLLWTGCCVFMVVMMLGGGLPNMPDNADTQVVVAVYGPMGVLAALTALLQLLVGVFLLLKKRRCRKLGVFCGVISCMSLWGCCVYPFSLGLGIYSLVILSGRNAIGVLDR